MQHNIQKQNEISKISPNLNELNKNFALVELDKLKFNEERDSLIKTNEQYKKELSKYQNYKDLPIEIDILIQSNQGCGIVKKRLAVITDQFLCEKNRRKVFENEFKEIIPDFFKVNFYKNKIDYLNKAFTELEFNIKRYMDMTPLLVSYEQRFQNNKSIIENIVSKFK